MKIWKLLGAFVMDGALFIALIWVLSYFKLIPPIESAGRIVLAVTWIGLGFKIFLGDLASGKFHYHKHGYDFCLTTMGAALSTFALQMLSDKDLLPKISSSPMWPTPAGTLAESIRRSDDVLGALFIVASLFALLTASICREIEQPDTKWKSVLSGLNFSIGAGAFAGYLLLLLGK